MLEHFISLVWRNAHLDSATSTLLIYKVAALLAGVALTCLAPVWRIVKHAVTYVHESGHAIATILMGGWVRSIDLNSDASGQTMSITAVNQRFRQALISFAGYPSPAVLAFGLVVAVYFEHAGAALGILGALTTVSLFLIRTAWGLVVLCVFSLATFSAVAFLAPNIDVVLSLVFAGIMLAGSGRTMRSHRRARLQGRLDSSNLSADVYGVSQRTGFSPGFVDGLWCLVWMGAFAGIMAVLFDFRAAIPT